MNNYFTKIKCPICKNHDFKVIVEASYPSDLSLDELKKFYCSSSDSKLFDQLVECKSCNLIYINPQLKKEIIESAYSEAIDPLFFAQNNSRIETFKSNFSKILNTYYLGAGPSMVLDVGCAGGAFPEAANQLGCNVIGVEPSLYLSERARDSYKLDIRSGTLEQNRFEDNTFDIVTLWDVIEHLVDPATVLVEIKRILKPNGIFVVNYPDHGSLACKMLGKKWPFYLSVHLIYFNTSTITDFMARSGFVVLKQSAYWQKLPLGYVLQRAAAYFGLFSYLYNLVSWFGLKDLSVKYNVGQTLLIAKNVK